jgi:hypothetical protein
MHDLCLIGVVSLNDPPRPMVDLSVNKCRDAGIKVMSRIIIKLDKFANLYLNCWLN